MLNKKSINKNKSDLYNLNFFNFSDTHLEIGETKHFILTKSKEIFNEVLSKVPTSSDYVFFTGDVIEARYYALKNLNELKKILKEKMTSIPYFFTMGNHDIRHKTTIDSYRKKDFIYFMKNLRSYKNNSLVDNREEAYWRYDLLNKKITFIGLDTSIKLSSFGEISKKQKKWLLDNLNAIDKNNYIIIFMHHPAVVFHKYTYNPAMSVYLLKNHDEITKIFGNYKNIKLVISGHTHTCGHVKKDGVNYVSSPSIITWPNMYTYFSIKRDKFMFNYYQIDNKDLINFSYHNAVKNISLLKMLGSPNRIIEYYKPPLTTKWIKF